MCFFIYFSPVIGKRKHWDFRYLRFQIKTHPLSSLWLLLHMEFHCYKNWILLEAEYRLEKIWTNLECSIMKVSSKAEKAEIGTIFDFISNFLRQLQHRVLHMIDLFWANQPISKKRTFLFDSSRCWYDNHIIIGTWCAERLLDESLVAWYASYIKLLASGMTSISFSINFSHKLHRLPHRKHVNMSQMLLLNENIFDGHMNLFIWCCTHSSW